jgi:hypothetical protein
MKEIDFLLYYRLNKKLHILLIKILDSLNISHHIILVNFYLFISQILKAIYRPIKSFLSFIILLNNLLI